MILFRKIYDEFLANLRRILGKFCENYNTGFLNNNNIFLRINNRIPQKIKVLGKFPRTIVKKFFDNNIFMKIDKKFSKSCREILGNYRRQFLGNNTHAIKFSKNFREL